MAIKSFCKDILYGNKITVGIRVCLGALFIFSGYFKVVDLEAFAAVIAQYRIIPSGALAYAAIMLPLLELILGGLLVAGYKTRAASFMGMILMLLFSIFIAINVGRGENFNCGCFELSRLGLGFDESVSLKLVIRDVVLALLFFVIYAAERHPLSIESLSEKNSLKDL